jgi:hypothetical protein
MKTTNHPLISINTPIACWGESYLLFSVVAYYLLLNIKHRRIVMTTENSKICTTCGVDKPLSEYHNDKRGRLGKQARCKACKSEKDKAYRQRESETLREKRKAYYKANKDAILENQKVYAEKNKEKVLENKRAYHEKNKETIHAKKREYYQKNKEYIKAKVKAYYVENKERIIERNNQYERERRRRDPIFRLTLNTKGAVYKALMRENGGKYGSKTLDALPFTIVELKEHLQSQFDEHMTWDNYGDYWHVDHIYPLSALPYDSLEHPHFALVWDLNNLRPLSAHENVTKNAQLTEPIPNHIKLFLEKQQKILDKSK